MSVSVDPRGPEALAAINCVRLQVFEMLGHPVNVRKTEESVAQIPAVLVTDSTNVHGRMKKDVYVPKGPEFRTAMELIGLKEASAYTHAN